MFKLLLTTTIWQQTSAMTIQLQEASAHSQWQMTSTTTATLLVAAFTVTKRKNVFCGFVIKHFSQNPTNFGCCVCLLALWSLH
jgi:hypothetical protein